jgi:16S rRNA (guanine(966)-N(2))-methyltransferase RsmD
MVRVISGLARGRPLKVPKGNIRPLSDQAKEALFNILVNQVADCSFLDLFAGSGAVGIEALSRGARLSIFVEIDRRSVQVIRENLTELGFDDRAEIFALPVNRALKILGKKQAKFDIIFLGAPYGSSELDRALKLLGSVGLLKPEGVAVAEHRFKTVLPEEFFKLKKFRLERYGDTAFSFYSPSSPARGGGLWRTSKI